MMNESPSVSERPPPLLEISHLRVNYSSRHGDFHALNNLSLSLSRGEILGIVGESGSGKSTLGNAIAKLLSPPGLIEEGKIYLDGKNITTCDHESMRRIRGKDIGFIFQDPMTSLNPLLSIEQQIVETITSHLELSKQEATARAIAWLDAVGINDADQRIKQYPHQFSGGMCQRVVIAIALSTEPKFIIADEPTTALDVSIQDQILKLIQKQCRNHRVACLLITHDMGVISAITDRTAVIYKGELVEIGDTKSVLNDPQHAYTKSLISAVPPTHKKLNRFPLVTYIEEAESNKKIDINSHWLGQSLAKTDCEGPLLSVQDIHLKFLIRGAFFTKNRHYLHAIKGVSFDVAEGETFGLVGESGSGKSTIARAITGLYPPDSGEVVFKGHSMTHNEKKRANNKRFKSIRRDMQMVFQNPISSLNPRMRVADIIGEPIRFHRLVENASQRYQIVTDLLNHVGLSQQAGQKFPHEFSGGQRQRISIARALATRPHLLLCDEPTSALDVSVQAQILNLLKDLQEELNLTMIFISHDLPVIRQMCDRIGVMKHGQLVEVNETGQLFAHAQHEYTRQLISLMPHLQATST